MGIAVETRKLSPAIPGGAFSCRNATRELLVNFGFEVFLKGALRMPKSKRPWNEDDVAKLKAMDGWQGTGGATAVQASKRGAFVAHQTSQQNQDRRGWCTSGSVL
jgi:hypothetical protein